MPTPFITEVSLKNYKSIAACKVGLESLMFLVGPNGAGKSNFLDSFKFVADSLSASLDHALRERGSIKEVRRKSGGHPTHFSIGIRFQIPDGPTGRYSFRVGAKPDAGFEVQTEECEAFYPAPRKPFSIREPYTIRKADSETQVAQIRHYFRVVQGRVVASSRSAPATLPDRLALVNFAGLSEFRPVFDALSRIEIYNLNPKEIATPQMADPTDRLRRDGANAASILRHIPRQDLDAINRYLGQIAPGIREVDTKPIGTYETMEFRQNVKGQKDPWRFLASSMSDGTLRAFGILLATLQTADTGPPLLGLEEPETAVHPAAAHVLLEVLRVAAVRRQILVTSHSPDLLDDPDLNETALLAVQSIDGITRIGSIDETSKDMLRRSLFTPGELLRQNQIGISPEPKADISDARPAVPEIEEMGNRAS